MKKILILFIFVIVYNTQFIKAEKFLELIKSRGIDEKDFKLYSKRNIKSTLKNESFSFNGFEKYESVPIIFPKDICLMNIENVRYAACLHLNKDGVKKFVVLKYQEKKYVNIYEQLTPLAISIDCKALHTKGYVALVYNLTDEVSTIHDGSPIYEINDSVVKVVQYFLEPFLSSVQFLSRGNGLILMQTYQNHLITHKLNCPIYKFSESFFNYLDKIPCNYAKRMETFIINSQIFIAVANYADEYGRTDTESTIYQFNLELKKFKLIQKIGTSAAIDVKYFDVVYENKRQHFLVFANSKENGPMDSKNLEAFSIIYKYENGRFIPFQKLLLYSVLQFLPVQSITGNFILLVACEDQEIKIFEYNGWKFEQSGVQLTEGALGRGVSNIRVFHDFTQTYIVVANEKMLMNETNIYIPIHKKHKNSKYLQLEIMEWCNKIYKKLSEIDVHKLLEKIEKTAKPKEFIINGQNFTHIEKANIKNAFVRKLIYPRKNITYNLVNSLIYAQKILDHFEEKIGKLSQKSDQQRSSSEDSIDTLIVNKLIIKNELNAKMINNISMDNLILEKVTADTIIVNEDLYKSPNNKRVRRNSSTIIPFDNTIDVLKVNNLQVTGNVNGIDLDFFKSKLLKKVGNQTITAPITINELKTNSLTINNRLINNLNTSKLVQIDNGNYVINQDIQFAKSIYVENLHINNRLNNINVLHGKLDVLLTNSNEQQIVDGVKIFDNVEVLEPIILGGTISGPELEKIKPISQVNDDLYLNGDYKITGDVLIKNLLSADNIYGQSNEKSLKYLMENGLHKNTKIIPMKMYFEKPVTANNSNINVANGKNLNKFVKLNSDAVQHIEGVKYFKNDLYVVNGYCEMNTVNDIDIGKLKNEIFTLNDEQNITGNMSFGKIITKDLPSENILLGSVNFKDILLTSTEQEIYGTVEIDKITVNNANITQLTTLEYIFNKNIEEIFQDTLNSDEKTKTFETDQNYSGDLNVNHLKIGSTINGISIKDIEYLLNKLENDIVFNESINFEHDMTAYNVNFEGKINGIKAEEFGKCWLLNKFDQEFTAPQTFNTITCEGNLKVNHQINDIEFENFINQTYWLDRVEYINNATFENTVTVQGSLETSGLINGIHFSNDVLLSHANFTQEIYGPISCKEKIFVTGEIKNVEKINNFDLTEMNGFLNSEKHEIIVENAIFENQPLIGTLNHRDLNQIVGDVWLSNVNTVIPGDFHFMDIFVQGNISVQGPVNNVDLNYLKDNYFSLTQDQEITTQINFKDDVIIKKEFRANNVHLEGGKIIDPISKSQFNFDHFTTHVLLKTGEQIITGQWNINEAYVEGDLNNVEINGLRLFDDVVRTDLPINDVTAPKYIESLSIDNLHCNPKATINNVNIYNWIENSVLSDGNNYTIHGTTTIDTAIILNDIQVDGYVNGIKFNENNLLLKSKEQIIYGNVKIVSKSSENQKILPSTIKYLETETINNLNVNKFLKNIAHNNQTELTITGTLEFNGTLNVENFNGNGYLYDLDTKKYFSKLEENLGVKNIECSIKKLNSVAEKLKASYEDPLYFISHFEHKQTIFGAIKKVVSFTMYWRNQLMDAIAILNGNEILKLDFYKWDIHHQIFVALEDFLWHPTITLQNLVNINVITLNGIDFLIIETHFNGNFYENILISNKYGLQNLIQLHSNASQQFIKIDANFNKECIISYTKSNAILLNYCPISKGDNNFELIQKSNIILSPMTQVISVKDSLVAILLHDSIEIWNLVDDKKLYQKLYIVSPTQITTINYQNNSYLAVMSTKKNQNSLDFGSVEIYKTVNSSAYFEHFQSIEINTPIEIEFHEIYQTGDLLLYILTDYSAKPFVVYQYKGVVGFARNVDSSTLPKGLSMNSLSLKTSHQYLTSVIFKGGVAFIETVLNKI